MNWITETWGLLVRLPACWLSPREMLRSSFVSSLGSSQGSPLTRKSEKPERGPRIEGLHLPGTTMFEKLRGLQDLVPETRHNAVRKQRAFRGAPNPRRQGGRTQHLVPKPWTQNMSEVGRLGPEHLVRERQEEEGGPPPFPKEEA